MFAFLPLTQSLIQREFEVVALLALVAACAWFVRGRDVLSGAAIAYLTWFKYWPVVLLGVFVVNRRLKGLAGFAGATVVLLLATQLLFGLEGFLIGRTANIIGGLVRPLGSGEVLYPAIPRGALKSDFCRQWIWGRGTAADVRWALCGVEDRFPWVPARAAFIAIVAITGLVFLWAGIVLGSRPLNVVDAKWRGIWEFSLLTIAGGTFVHAHYYYFIVFVLPLSALVFFYATRPDSRRPVKIALWAVAYVLLNAFMIPASWLTRLLKQDAWSLYLDSGFCLLGLLMLLGLVLWEFSRLAVESRAVAHA
jgi:hypothetical protein